MKVRLPDVTLVLIDGTCPELSRLSLQDSMAQLDCPEVLVCSPYDIDVPGTQWIKTPNWSDRLGPSAFIWYELPDLVKTDWMLLTSWDAWVIDASLWSNEFLDTTMSARRGGTMTVSMSGTACCARAGC